MYRDHEKMGTKGYVYMLIKACVLAVHGQAQPQTLQSEKYSKFRFKDNKLPAILQTLIVALLPASLPPYYPRTSPRSSPLAI